MKDNNEIFQNNYWNQTKIKIQHRHRFILDNLGSFDSLLDVGCGDGFLLSLISKKNKKANLVGIDISEIGLRKAKKKNLNVRKIDFSINKLPYEDGEFDVIVLSEVLEHLFNPEFILKEAYRVAKKKVIITTPNFNSITQRFQVLIGEVPEYNISKKGHCYWFNYKILKHFLDRVGFQRIKFYSLTYFKNNFILSYIFQFLGKFYYNMFSISLFVVAFKK